MQNITEKFRQGIEKGYKKYLEIHPRSSKKIIPIHSCISEIILDKLGGKAKEFQIKSMGFGDEKEFNYEGKYYSKDLDITILYKNEPISGIGLKFITSNYKQNSNNYFENMLGETANIKNSNFLYAQILIFKFKIPYYSSKKKTFIKIEHINNNNIKKYLRLHNDKASELYHKPDLIFLNFIETGDEKYFENIVNSYEKGNPKEINKLEFHKKLIKKVKVRFIDTNELIKHNFSKETLEFIEKVSDFDKFIDAFVNLTNCKIYGK